MNSRSSYLRARVQSAAVCLGAAVCLATGVCSAAGEAGDSGGAGDPGEAGSTAERAGDHLERRPLLEAAQTISVAEIVSPAAPTSGFEFTAVDNGWIRTFWDKHKWHLLTTFLVVETDYLYARQVGTSRSPLLFGQPTGLDSSTHDATYDENASLNFVENNKTSLLRAVALGSILGSHQGEWGRSGDDLIGLLEAEKFNTATTGLVKRIVGRRRPALDRADPDLMTPEEYDLLQSSDSGHLSFYSAATSEAFTYCSYLDLVVARRLGSHRGWRVATGLGFYGLAGYIGYTRLRQGDHYLTDVLAGAAAGTFVGRGFYRANHRDEYEDGRAGEDGDATLRGSSRFHFSPPMPVPGGAFVSMTVELGR